MLTESEYSYLGLPVFWRQPIRIQQNIPSVFRMCTRNVPIMWLDSGIFFFFSHFSGDLKIDTKEISKTFEFTDESVRQAVKIYKNIKGNLETLREEYGIPVAAVYRKVKGIHFQTTSGQIASSSVDDTAIINCITIASGWNFLLDCDDIRKLAEKYNLYIIKIYMVLI